MIKNKYWKFVVIFSIVTVFLLTSITTTTNAETRCNSDIVISDISFGFKKIIATIENNGNEDANVTVSFSIQRGWIYPCGIGNYDVTIPSGETQEILQEFTGIGFIDFHVRIDDIGIYESTKGIWFFFFGIELPDF